MTEHQRLFLVQARSDFVVFEWLQKQQRNGELPASHALHYLQMATELLGKSHGQTAPQLKGHSGTPP